MSATMPVDRITIFCFAASYGVAVALEVLYLLRPGAVQRFLALGFGAAGLLAHTLFLIVQQPPIAYQFGSLLFLAWILAVFYFYGSIHHRRLAWAIFVLPLVLGLVGLAAALGKPETDSPPSGGLAALQGERFWGLVHGGLLLLAAVGVCVAFVASVMYLVQAHRLRAKTPPGQGLRLLSLERLEEMRRRAINWAFPLLTLGLLVGLVLMMQRVHELEGWTDPKVVGSAVLWAVFALLLVLRYGYHLRGRHLAVLTIVAFVLLVFTLASAHTLVQGGCP
jgi:ABC-type transport system involved in cytochrome c biogenesis permease subunit